MEKIGKAEGSHLLGVTDRNLSHVVFMLAFLYKQFFGQLRIE